MPKFKVGDRVIGNAKASDEYSVTIQGWTGVVREVWDMGWMRVSEKKDSPDDKIYLVKEWLFDLDNRLTTVCSLATENTEACESIVAEIEHQMASDDEGVVAG